MRILSVRPMRKLEKDLGEKNESCGGSGRCSGGELADAARFVIRNRPPTRIYKSFLKIGTQAVIAVRIIFFLFIDE